jgi:glycosyltransferase 2 family protein
MKFDNRFFLVIIGAISLYAIFLFISDYSIISNKIINFKFEYLPIILIFVTISWLALFGRWILLLKLLKIQIPFRENMKIYFSGFALAITPGKFGEIIKSQLMKDKFNIPRTTTAPLLFVERLYDLVGAVIVSFVGISILGFGIYVIFAASIFLVIIFVLISSRNLFTTFISVFGKIKYTSRFLIPLSESYEIIRTTTRGKIIVYASLLSIMYWLIESIGVYFVITSFGFDSINYFEIVSIYSSSLILGGASLIPGGIGVTEGSLIGLLNHQGIPLATSFVLVVFIRFFTLWYGVIVGFFALKFSGGFSMNKKIN